MNVQEIKKAPRPRYSGILVHPTSFPSPYGIGDLGDGAYAFIDFLYDAGQTLWQCLPLGPTGFGDSPYQAFSAFAGQPLLISPDLQSDQPKRAAYPVLQEEYNAACYCPAHGVCTHPTASRSPRILLKPAVSSLPAPHLSICKILCSPDHP